MYKILLFTLLSFPLFSQTSDTLELNRLFKTDTSREANSVRLLIGNKEAIQRISLNLVIGDPATPAIHVYIDSFKILSYSTVYSKYLRVVNNEYLYEEGEYEFKHDVSQELFTVTYCGEKYLNFHARLFAKDKTRALYMINPHTYVEYNEDYLRFYSDDEGTLIYFYN